MTLDKEFPALHQQLADWQALYRAEMNVVWIERNQGKREVSTSDYAIEELKAKIDELTYVLRQMADDRIHISSHTVLVSVAIFLFIMSLAAVVTAFLN